MTALTAITAACQRASSTSLCWQQAPSGDPPRSSVGPAAPAPRVSASCPSGHRPVGETRGPGSASPAAGWRQQVSGGHRAELRCPQRCCLGCVSAGAGAWSCTQWAQPAGCCYTRAPAAAAGAAHRAVWPYASRQQQHAAAPEAGPSTTSRVAAGPHVMCFKQDRWRGRHPASGK